MTSLNLHGSHHLIWTHLRKDTGVKLYKSCLWVYSAFFITFVNTAICCWFIMQYYYWIYTLYFFLSVEVHAVPERVCVCVYLCTYCRYMCVRLSLGVSAFGSGGCLPLMVFLLFVCKGRQDVLCLSAHSGRWKPGEGVEVAECCSGNWLSFQKSFKNSLLLPSAFLLSHNTNHNKVV